MLYAVDTARNVCPSIHVFNSVTLMIGYRRSRCFDEPGRRWMRPAANVLGAAIILSTMLLKQHSCIDVVLGAALAFALDAAASSLERSERCAAFRSGSEPLLTLRFLWERPEGFCILKFSARWWRGAGFFFWSSGLRSARARGREGCFESPSLPLDSTLPATS